MRRRFVGFNFGRLGQLARARVRRDADENVVEKLDSFFELVEQSAPGGDVRALNLGKLA